MSICYRLFSHTAIAVGAAVSLAGTANAAVVRWECNVSIPANTTGLFFNVSANSYGTSNVTGWDLQIYSNSSTPSIVFNLANFAGLQSGAAPFYLPAANLPEGTLVSASAFFTTSTDGATPATFAGGGPTTGGAWFRNAVNYFGFKFQANDGFVHYGFGQMTVGATANVRTLNYLEWETVPGVGLVVPAPGALALAGLCSLARSRRRR